VKTYKIAGSVGVSLLPSVTSEMLARLAPCPHGTHQVDENQPGMLAVDGTATTCPDRRDYNNAFAGRHSYGSAHSETQARA